MGSSLSGNTAVWRKAMIENLDPGIAAFLIALAIVVWFEYKGIL